ncbi:molecular chaperone [Enterobacter sp. CC120223-11]|uniref:fimbrial biogenesis chaperone n=1 Tax=Enterobacter sp. CC120223-11 TaxID=1378073 RepID=UPI000BD2A23C|nr:molecular chaperone [Enterobacter sp. CC120223-11]SNY79871.1 P pilus assembly protein, chaperone PapD [Enterobacter sp. CC120223-11]
MKILINILTALLLSVGGVNFAQAAEENTPGISFYVLRVIYPEGDKQGVTLTAYNKTPASYLMQSWIRPVDLSTGDVDLNWKGKPAMPFIVTPPLSRLEANNELVLRIRRNDVPLPNDRESVFFISMKALPAQKSVGKQMVMTVVSNIKLFYRPAGLEKRAVADMAPKLNFTRDGQQLTASNPTPYWLTFSRLSVGNVQLDKPSLRLMVPPFGKQSYTLPASSAGKITWQLIDEDGWDTPAEHQD